jgi:hypothetical protein
MRTSFFSPSHVDKHDDALQIENAAKDLIVLSESTVQDSDIGECSATAAKAAGII